MKTKLLVLIMLLFGIYNLQAQQIEQSKEKQESTQVQKDNVSDKPTDEEAARYTRIALIIAGVILFLKWKYSGRCKKCKRYRAMKTYNKDLVGTMKTKEYNKEMITSMNILEGTKFIDNANTADIKILFLKIKQKDKNINTFLFPIQHVNYTTKVQKTIIPALLFYNW